jgi:hypothetical protein
MKKLYYATMMLACLVPYTSFAKSDVSRFSGRILLQVESHGEAWYANPDDGKYYFLGKPEDAFEVMKDFGIGITENYYNYFATNGVPSKFLGKFLLRVQDRGQAYYVSPRDSKMHYIGRVPDALGIMREQGIGISNAVFNKITKGKTVLNRKKSIDDKKKYLEQVIELKYKLQTIYVIVSGSTSVGSSTMRTYLIPYFNEVETLLTALPNSTASERQQYKVLADELERYKRYLNKTLEIWSNTLIAKPVAVDTSTWKVYANERRGFSMHIPTDWVCYDANEEAIFCDNDVHNKDRIEYDVSFISIPNCQNTLVISSNTFLIDGMRWVGSEYLSVYNFDYLKRSTDFTTCSNNVRIELSGNASADGAGMYVMEEVAKSFTLNKSVWTKDFNGAANDAYPMLPDNRPTGNYDTPKVK